MTPTRALRALIERRDWLAQLPAERLKWHVTGELEALNWLVPVLEAQRDGHDVVEIVSEGRAHLGALADRAAWLVATGQRYDSRASHRHKAVASAISVSLRVLAPCAELAVAA